MGDLFPKRLIETAAAPFYVDLLGAYAGHCERRGLRLVGDEVGTPAWYKALDTLFNAPDAERPETLAEALTRISRLATESGHARIQEVVGERGGSLFERGERLTPCELAMRAFLHGRTCFDLAFARHRASFTRRFVELMPRTPEPIGPRITASAIDRLRASIASFYFARNHTGFADVDVRRIAETDAYAFALVHGRAPRIVGLIDEREQRAAARQVQEKQDVLHVDGRTGRLGVSVASVVEERAMARAFGEALFGDVDHYREETLFTAAPLADEGLKVLDPTGIDGVERVTLKRIGFVDEGGLHGELRGGLLQAWDRGVVRAVFAEAQITSLHLQITVKLPQGRSLRSVTITPPNRIELDRRGTGEILVRGFLERRGFGRAVVSEEPWLLVDAA